MRKVSGKLSSLAASLALAAAMAAAQAPLAAIYQDQANGDISEVAGAGIRQLSDISAGTALAAGTKKRGSDEKKPAGDKAGAKSGAKTAKDGESAAKKNVETAPEAKSGKADATVKNKATEDKNAAPDAAAKKTDEKNIEKKAAERFPEIAALSMIPAEYGFAARIDVAKFLAECGAPELRSFMAAAVGKENAEKIKTLDVAFLPKRSNDGIFNFIAVAGGDVDFEKAAETVKAYEGAKAGEHDGVPTFRFYNIAGIHRGGKFVFGTVAALKKAVAVAKSAEKKGADRGLEKSLADNAAFAEAYAGALANISKGASVAGAANGDFLKIACDGSEVTYKEMLMNTEVLTFAVNGKDAAVGLSHGSNETALKFSNELSEQFSRSAEESKEALDELDVIEAESNRARDRKAATGEMAFTRKMLKLVVEFNKSASFTCSGNDIFVKIQFGDGLIKSLCSLITTHPDSWGSIAGFFISPEISCRRYAKIIENATLIYLSKNPKEKGSVTEEKLYMDGIIGTFYKCPRSDRYDISVDEKGKIAVSCPAHK